MNSADAPVAVPEARPERGEYILFPTQALTWSGSTGSGSCQSQPRIWGTPTRTWPV